MQHWRGLTNGILALGAAACTPTIRYGALQSQKYSGSPVFQTREEWGTPVSKTRFLTGTVFYQFKKPNTDCMMSA